MSLNHIARFEIPEVGSLNILKDDKKDEYYTWFNECGIDIHNKELHKVKEELQRYIIAIARHNKLHLREKLAKLESFLAKAQKMPDVIENYRIKE